jgi:ferrous iron transport protein A
MTPSDSGIPRPQRLSDAPSGRRLFIHAVNAATDEGQEWVARLRELGFIEGEPIQVLRRGQPGGEPLAVRVGVSTFALRRAEAACIQVVPADAS